MVLARAACILFDEYGQIRFPESGFFLPPPRVT